MTNATVPDKIDENPPESTSSIDKTSYRFNAYKRASFKPPSVVNRNVLLQTAADRLNSASLGGASSNKAEKSVACLPAAPNAHVEKDPEAIYFAVLFCRLQPAKKSRKNKRYEDGFIEIKDGKRACLYNEEGKMMSRATVRREDVSSLRDGSHLLVGAWEVEIDTPIEKEKFDSGEAFLKQSRHMVANDISSCQGLRGISGFRKVSVGNHFKNDEGKGTIKLNEEHNSDTICRSASSKGQLFLHDPYTADAIVLNKIQWMDGTGKDSKGRPYSPVVLDPLLARQMRPHQIEGVRFLYECCSGIRNVSQLGCILADAMGLGKTLQTLALIWTVLRQGPYGRPLVNKAIIVAPSSLCQNWANEARKWLGDTRMRTLIISSGSQASHQVAEFRHGAVKVGIISYDTIRQHANSLSDSVGLLVADEGHRLKSATGNKTIHALSALRCYRRILLTGTPVQNNLQEFFAMCDFCNPDALGSLALFNRVFGNPITRSRDRDATRAEIKLGEARSAELSRRVQSFVLRRGSEVNMKYLPPLTMHVIFCRPTIEQIELFSNELGSTSVRRILETSGSDLSDHVLRVLNNLRKIANHPALYESGDADNNCEKNNEMRYKSEKSGKMSVLFCMLKWIIEEDDACKANGINEDTQSVQCKGFKYSMPLKNGAVGGEVDATKQKGKFDPRKRCVVVSQSTSVLDIIEKICHQKGWETVRLDGSTEISQRQNLVNSFNSFGRGQVFLLSTTAGGAGLNLTGASRLILYDSHWNPAMDSQAMARIWREGQRYECNVYRLVTTGTLEEKIYQRQRAKGDMATSTVDISAKLDSKDTFNNKKKSSKGQFSHDELKQLFSLRTDTNCDTADVLSSAKKTFTNFVDNQDLDYPLLQCITEGVVTFVHVESKGEFESDKEGNHRKSGSLDSRPGRSLPEKTKSQHQTEENEVRPEELIVKGSDEASQLQIDDDFT